MTKKIRAAGGHAAGRDVDSKVSLDVEVGEGIGVEHRISIGTVITGPVHIHLVIDRAPPAEGPPK